jgi:hypothetical protein
LDRIIALTGNAPNPNKFRFAAARFLAVVPHTLIGRPDKVIE